MTDRPFSADPGQGGPGRQLDGHTSEGPYWQAGYRPGGYDQRTADLQEIRTRHTTATDKGLDPVEVQRRRQLSEQLQADLIQAENVRAAYLDELEAERTRQLDEAGAAQDRSALSSGVIGAWSGNASPGSEMANTPAHGGGGRDLPLLAD